jgi:hypothetical protein
VAYFALSLRNPFGGSPAAAALGLLAPFPPRQFHCHPGRHREKVEGRIAREGVSKSGAIRFLNFEGTQRGDLTLVFFVKSNAENDTQENLAACIAKPSARPAR